MSPCSLLSEAVGDNACCFPGVFDANRKLHLEAQENFKKLFLMSGQGSSIDREGVTFGGLLLLLTAGEVYEFHRVGMFEVWDVARQSRISCRCWEGQEVAWCRYTKTQSLAA